MKTEKNKKIAGDLIPDNDLKNLDQQPLGANDIASDAEKLIAGFEPIPHKEILAKLLGQIEKIDFREKADFIDEKQSLKLKHLLVVSIEHTLDTAKLNQWQLCKNLDFIYLYNGAFWSMLEKDELQAFLGEASLKMGVDKFDAKFYMFREQLFKQFLSDCYLSKPSPSEDLVSINLKNGTYDIGPKGHCLRAPDPADFLTYQLPFEYDNSSEAPIFKNYLNTIMPDIDRQKILAEYLGYLFIKNNTLKLEKTLLLFGTGANGKSVFFEVVNALLGGVKNVSSYSLQNLTSDTGYARAMIANKLVNYASEINGKLESSIFKLLSSGEPVEARLPYGNPFTLTNYAKLIFNCNELPKEVEQSHAFFRRFLIVPFDVTIPDNEQDKELSKKIIANELSGVFNWVLEGLNRLLSQKDFSESEAVKKQLADYKLQSDSVLMFLDEDGYHKSIEEWVPAKALYSQYVDYCRAYNFLRCSSRTFNDRLRKNGFLLEKKNVGFVVYAEQINYPEIKKVS